MSGPDKRYYAGAYEPNLSIFQRFTYFLERLKYLGVRKLRRT